MARFLLLYRNERIVLTPGDFTLGRGEQCGLPLDDEQVSRRHATLHVHPDRVVLEDLGSRNGVYVNEEKVGGPQRLRHGDRMRLGAQEIELIDQGGRNERAAQTTVPGAAPPGSDRPPPPGLQQLSAREVEVLRLIAWGYTHKEIAERLGISVKTVETYRARIIEKLGVRTRPELVKTAIDAGLLTKSPRDG